MYTIYICMNNPYSYNYSFRINIKVNNSTFEFEIINNICNVIHYAINILLLYTGLLHIFNTSHY